jgi:hypothetical protein
MTKHHVFGRGWRPSLAGVVLCTLGVALVSPLAAQPAGTPTSHVMTLSGCLRSAAAGDTRTAPQPVIYTLDVSAAKNEAGPGQTASRKRAEGKSTAPLKPATYTIVAPAKIALANHVNHRVELTGRMREGNATTTGSPGPPSRETPEGSDPTAAAASRTFEVESLKMLATSCPPAGAW